jgi:hypothetical protein
MSNLVHQFLKQNGPSLSSEITADLVKTRGLSPEAARQRVSRTGKDVLRLDLSFPKRAKFLFLKDQAGSGHYWERLEQALLSSKSAYGFAITALSAREGIIPKSHFEIVSGSPIKQKKHLSADVVLNKLLSANLLKEIHVEGIGPCVYLGLHINHIDSLIPAMKARIFAEELILIGLKNWMRKLGFISYNKVAIRNSDGNPTVSTTAWDLAGPSYLSPLISFKGNDMRPNPGFVVCDILLNDEVTELGISPFLQKLGALRSLKNVGKQLCFFVAHSFSEKAFNKLKSIGISPATTSAIFDTETARGMKALVELLSQIVSQPVSPEKIDVIFSTLGKIEGAAHRLRGALFEYIVADAMRCDFGQSVELNRVCQTFNGSKEADVICFNNKKVTFIEAKGYNFNKKVTLEEIDYWLQQQVPIFRAFSLAHTDWKSKKMTFEFWTTGTFEPDAFARLEQAKESIKKYHIDFKDFKGVTEKVKLTESKTLIKTFSDHFLNHPMAHKQAR